MSSAGRPRRRRRATAIGATVAVVAGISVAAAVMLHPGAARIASAAGSESPSHTPVQLTTPAAPFMTDPHFFPPADGGIGQVTVTRAQAIDIAQSQASDATGGALPRAEQAELPTYSRLMSYGDAVDLVGDGPNPRIDPAHDVWVVTVLGHHIVDLAPGEKAAPVDDEFTIVVDATSGYVILGAIGIASLTG